MYDIYEIGRLFGVYMFHSVFFVTFIFLNGNPNETCLIYVIPKSVSTFHLMAVSYSGILNEVLKRAFY